MIPYIVGKLAPNLSHLTRGLVKYVPGRDYFRAVPSQNGDKYVTSPPPQSLNWSHHTAGSSGTDVLKQDVKSIMSSATPSPRKS